MTFMKTWTSSTITTMQRSLNVSLGKKFAEGNLYFGDMKQVLLSESVYRGRAGNDRGSPIQRTTHARCPAHLLWPVLEPHCLDEGLTGEEKLCPMCKKKPTLVEGQSFTDGFTSDSGMSLLQDVSCVPR